jgi:bifunctional UDP-N-acetylglucosamine pyrophosphorylase/glucosamine-1-phosphate N-acetyltransferase
VRSPDTVLIIPAAGAGTRLQSPIPKVLTPVNGRAMIDHLFDLYRDVVRRFVLIVHPSFDAAVRAHCTIVAPDLDVEYAQQSEPTGMLDAILLGAEAARRRDAGRIWITWCDQIGVHRDTIATLRRLSEERSEAHIIFPTAPQAHPYIHLERDAEGRVFAIRQQREGDAMPAVGESDMGLFSLSPDACFDWLPRFGAGARQSSTTRERNFLPFIPWMAQQGHHVLTFSCTHEMEAVGINTPEDRRRMEEYLLQRDRS